MSHHCTGGGLRAPAFEQTVAVGLSRARLGENLFEWEQGQTHLPEQMKNERADFYDFQGELMLKAAVSAFHLQKGGPVFPTGRETDAADFSMTRYISHEYKECVWLRRLRLSVRLLRNARHT